MSTSEIPSNVSPDEIRPIAPCEHMTNLVSALADETLSGPARWYTLFHVTTCRRCKPALQALRLLRARLQEMNRASQSAPPPTLSPENQRRLVEELDAIDHAQRATTTSTGQ